MRRGHGVVTGFGSLPEPHDHTVSVIPWRPACEGGFRSRTPHPPGTIQLPHPAVKKGEINLKYPTCTV